MDFAYDIENSYELNYERGPLLPDAIPVPPTSLKTFLGLPVASRLGIAAGLLLNAKWVKGYAQRGFDLLTYKTVRSNFRPSYDQPNWVFVEPAGEGRVRKLQAPPSDPRKISSSVCFGMPSMPPEIWRKDMADARKTLRSGQLLIASIVATPDSSNSEASLKHDYQKCAELACEAGADIIEANFSCPNVCTAEGEIYHDAELSKRLAMAIKEAIQGTPLLLKIGAIPTGKEAERFLQAIAGVANGVTLVNCLVAEVLDENGRPVFGEMFRRAGVLGRMIHRPSVAIVETMSGIIKKHTLPITIAAVGGASTVEDIGEFFKAGAEAVLFGSSPMYLPNLAVEAKTMNPLW